MIRTMTDGEGVEREATAGHEVEGDQGHQVRRMIAVEEDKRKVEREVEVETGLVEVGTGETAVEVQEVQAKAIPLIDATAREKVAEGEADVEEGKTGTGIETDCIAG